MTNYDPLIDSLDRRVAAYEIEVIKGQRIIIELEQKVEDQAAIIQKLRDELDDKEEMRKSLGKLVDRFDKYFVFGK